MKVFFTKKFEDFNDSRQDFRKKFIKFFQISCSFFLIIYMILVFPFRKLDLEVYIFLPGYLVFNNIVCCLLRKKKYEKFCSTYLMLILIVVPIFSLELSFVSSENYNPQRSLFSGLQTGFLYSICYVAELSSIRIFIISFFYSFHLVLRQYLSKVDNSTGASIVCLSIILLLNYIYYNKEMMNFKVWASLKKSNESLGHFQKLIQNFPNQIIVVDKQAFENNQPIYFNEEAIRLEKEMVLDSEGSLRTFLEIFKIEVATDESVKAVNIPIVEGEKNLADFVKQLLVKDDVSHGDFHLLQVCSYKYKKGLKEGSLQGMEIVFTEKTRRKKWEIKFGWVDWNESSALIIIFNDITLTHKLRDLKKLDKYKDILLASVSHELRTPLNGIIGMIDVAEEQTPQSATTVKKCLSIAKGSAKALLLMINDILDISQIRNGTLRLNFENVAISDIVNEVVPLMTIQMKNKNIEFIYENQCPKDVNVYADPVRLKQILMNLLGNACKFTSEGFVKLKLKTSNVEEIPKTKFIMEENIELGRLLTSSPDHVTVVNPERIVELCVEDSGLGIPDDKIPKLFKLFGKLEDKNNSSGVGLGLAISQSLAKKMHPSGISVQSVLGKGSIFFFSLVCSKEDNNNYLPLTKFESSMKSLNDVKLGISTNDPSSPNRLSDSVLKKFKLLIVDDDQVNHLVMELYLKDISDKISFDKAYNGLEALNIVQEQAKKAYYYNLIIMDCDMPVMNGLLASKAITELHKKGILPALKIVALTANVSLSEKENCLCSGMSEVWTKPISKKEFFTKISKIMDFSHEL